MATLEDKILGEKTDYYCSSSSGSDEEKSDNEEDANSKSMKQIEEGKNGEFPEIGKWEGTSQNTGPKGVITDWQRFKQLEAEKRQANDREQIALAKKLTLTVRSALDEEKAQMDDPELAEMLNDEFLLEYQKKRMKEMLENENSKVKFGELIFLKNGQEYLDCIDKEEKFVKVVIHIYENHVPACNLMNTCLAELAKIYENVKFCAIVGCKAGLSRDFKLNGVPAILVYKNGTLIGNFVKLRDELGNDFCTEDVQAYLVENGILEDKTLIPKIIKDNKSDDSD